MPSQYHPLFGKGREGEKAKDKPRHYDGVILPSDTDMTLSVPYKSPGDVLHEGQSSHHPLGRI